jgi:hypothetical protein
VLLQPLHGAVMGGPQTLLERIRGGTMQCIKRLLLRLEHTHLRLLVNILMVAEMENFMFMIQQLLLLMGGFIGKHLKLLIPIKQMLPLFYLREHIKLYWF